MNSESVFLYLHLPKTGGTTLDSVIYAQYHDGSGSKQENGYFTAGIYYMPDGFIWKRGDRMKENDLRAMRRPDTTAIQGHFYFGLHEQLDKPVRYMTLLRDPVRRVSSLYNHLRQYEALPDGMTLSQFVDDPPIAEACNDQVRRLTGNAPGEPCTADDLKLAKDNLANHIDFFGITDRYDASLFLARKTFGWVENIHYLPKLVNSNPASKQNTREELDRVAAANKLDLELYQFACELFEKRITSEGEPFQEALAEYQQQNQKLLETHGPSSTIS